MEILNYKWENYGKKYYYKDLLIFALFLLIFTINAVIFIPDKMLNGSNKN